MALFNHNEEIQTQAQFPKYWILTGCSAFFFYSRVLVVWYIAAITCRKVILNIGWSVWIQNEIPYSNALVYILLNIRVIKWQFVSQIQAIYVFCLTLKVDKKNGFEYLQMEHLTSSLSLSRCFTLPCTHSASHDIAYLASVGIRVCNPRILINHLLRCLGIRKT